MISAMIDTINITGGDNYVKIPVQGKSTPLLIQWGITSSNNNTTTQFPIKYNTTPYVFPVIYRNNTEASYAVQLKTITTSSFTIYANGGANSAKSYWISVGY